MSAEDRGTGVSRRAALRALPATAVPLVWGASLSLDAKDAPETAEEPRPRHLKPQEIRDIDASVSRGVRWLLSKQSDDGAFALRNLPDGPYHVQAAAEGGVGRLEAVPTNARDLRIELEGEPPRPECRPGAASRRSGPFLFNGRGDPG